MAERYAVVSCHVERPLDDRVWAAFARVQERRPGGFRIAALMRPPDPAAGEDESAWLERARSAAQRAPLGHHTHFGGVEVARPAGGDAVERFEREVEWLRDRDVPARFFCGGGWFMDERLAASVAAAGYVDCSGTAFPLPWLAPGEPRLRLSEPAWLDADGTPLLELPTTHSLGSLARGFVRLPRGFVHVHFHDWELTDGKRRLALSALLHALARRARVVDLAQAAELAEHAPRRAFAEAAA